ncbi:hypothetical protein SAMN05192581_1007136 [Bacteroides ovatus]|uniref:Uncharacterized protein n=1 Tax=Bacteroides ovatus TaxID=28116 RepID=A0A1G6G2W5_BACOV|nr:hypothetical protein SAMN05192581_1007136 [Bacteroides ovatus]
MKKFWLACTMIIAMGVSSCVDSDKDLYQEDPGTGTNPLVSLPYKKYK